MRILLSHRVQSSAQLCGTAEQPVLKYQVNWQKDLSKATQSL